jgi:5'-nucleotidase/UDP-sugar diphosphatase
MFRHLRALGLVCFILAIPALLIATEKLTILHLNDTHGQIEPVKAKDGSEYGGFARVAYIVDSLRTEAEDEGRVVYFLHAGDALQGPPISNMSKGELDFELLNQMGVTAMVVGNHEFDFGQENLNGLVEIAEFPVISANVIDEAGRLYDAFIEKEVGKERILVAGLTTPATPIGTHPDNVVGLSFLSPDSVISALIDSLDCGDKDLVIALTHLGWQADSALAEQVSEIDLIVGGHTHSVIEQPQRINSSLIVQAGARTVYLGKLEMELKKGEIQNYSYELILLSDSIPEDPVMAARIAEASKKLDEKLGVPIGKTEVALVPGFPQDEEEALSLGNLLAQIMQEETGADFAFFNQGGVRATILPGDITMKDVLTALPFVNTVVSMELTAEQVQELLNYNVSLGGQSGGTLHLEGVTYEAKDSSAVDIRIGGEPLDPAKSYKIATNNFLAAGGDGYEMLKQGTDIYDTGTGVNSMLAGYIERVGVIEK